MEDPSYSVIVEEKKISSDKPLSDVLPKKAHVWKADNVVKSCSHCGVPFSLTIRRHHCRMCGHIFCNNCSNFRDEIPEDLVTDNAKKVTWGEWMYSFTSTIDLDKQRVCIGCHESLLTLAAVRKIIMVFSIIKLSIKDLNRIKAVSENWMRAANYCLTIFKNTQYKLPNETFSDMDKRALWSNIKYLNKHSKYLFQLLKVINDEEEFFTIMECFNHDKNTTCYDMMCTKSCREKLTTIDIINLLSYYFSNGVQITDNMLKTLINLIQSPDEELICFIPMLVNFTTHDVNNIISDFLVKVAISNDVMLSTVYWELLYHNDIITTQKIKEALNSSGQQSRLLKLLDGYEMVNRIDQISLAVQNQKDIGGNILGNTYLPILPDINITNICLDKIKVKNSACKPIIIPCVDSNNIPHSIMYKRENLRKDQIVMNVVRLVNYILKKEEGLDLDVVSYNIIPRNNETGLIEIVNDSETLYHIMVKLKQSTHNYLEKKNKTSAFEIIRNRFINSCAVYSVVTYILGVGDRHLDNIMLTSEGRLFHIDFGYILGYDPAFKTGIRITDDMINTMGGMNDEGYERFKQLTSTIYNTLRYNIDIFINMLLLLNRTCDLRLTDKDIINHIIDRLLPGENKANAEIHIIAQLENQTMLSNIHDWVHYHREEGTVTNGLSYFTGYVTSFFK